MRLNPIVRRVACLFCTSTLRTLCFAFLGWALFAALFFGDDDAARSTARFRSAPPLPLAKQIVGYQFTAHLNLPPHMKRIVDEFKEDVELYEETRDKERADLIDREAESKQERDERVTNQLSSDFLSITSGMGLSEISGDIEEFCRRFELDLGDPCTKIRFNAFAVSCEFTVVVSSACDKERITVSAVFNKFYYDMRVKTIFVASAHDQLLELAEGQIDFSQTNVKTTVKRPPPPKIPRMHAATH